jgi:hypothetical protein
MSGCSRHLSAALAHCQPPPQLLSTALKPDGHSTRARRSACHEHSSCPHPSHIAAHSPLTSDACGNRDGARSRSCECAPRSRRSMQRSEQRERACLGGCQPGRRRRRRLQRCACLRAERGEERGDGCAVGHRCEQVRGRASKCGDRRGGGREDRPATRARAQAARISPWRPCAARLLHAHPSTRHIRAMPFRASHERQNAAYRRERAGLMSLYGAGAPSEYSLAASLPAAGILTPNSLPAASAGAAPYSFERSWLAHLYVSDAKCARERVGHTSAQWPDAAPCRGRP